jgi:hypothetical protein
MWENGDLSYSWFSPVGKMTITLVRTGPTRPTLLLIGIISRLPTGVNHEAEDNFWMYEAGDNGHRNGKYLDITNKRTG